MVQRRSASFAVYNDFSRTSSNNLKWPSLEQRRQIAKVTMFYKIIDNLISIPHDHLTKSSAPTGHNPTSSQNKHILTLLLSFGNQIVADYIVISKELNNFKLNLDNY